MEANHDINKMLEGLPKFPENTLGLKRGSVLTVASSEVDKSTGLKVGRRIPIGFDGKYIRSGGFAWSMDQLIAEIRDKGWWEIDEQEVDLSDPARSYKFAQQVEGLFEN